MDSTKEYLNQHLERYEIHERLGTGGMARVYRGYDRTLDRPVAIKILHEHLAEEPAFLQRFEREAKYIAALNHPRIVQVFDYNTLMRKTDPICYMIMSYIDGPSLRDVLETACAEGQPLPHDQVEKIMLDLLSALDYAHHQGMVHRDVKPANILINQQGNAILTDFGIAHLSQYTKLTQEGATIGTPAYMSPEQAGGEELDGRSDCYAAGIILYEMLTGSPPFTDDGSLSVLLKHINEPVPSLSETSNIEHPYLDAVIFTALAKYPHQRYQSAAEFADDLKAAFSGKKPKAIVLNTEMIDTVTPLPTALNSDKVLHPTSIAAPRVFSLWPIAAASMTLLAFALFIILLTQQENNGTAEPSTISDIVESMTGEGPTYIDTTFSEDDPYLFLWPQDTLRGLTRTMDNASYRIVNQRSGEAIATLFDSAEDYQQVTVTMEATLENSSTPNSGYGIVFRYVDDDNYNVLAVDGVGRYSIWRRENGTWHELRDANETWSPSEEVATIGEVNQLKIEIDHQILTAYINETQITSVQDGTVDAGKVGIYLASPEAGTANVRILRYTIEPIRDEQDGVESMVGGMEDP